MLKKLTKICSLLMICLFGLFSLTACGDREITYLEIKTGTFDYDYEQGDTISLEDLIVVAKYNDGTEEEIQYGNEGLTVSDFNTETTGKKQVTIKYGEKEISVEVEVEEPSETTLLVREIEALPTLENVKLTDKNSVTQAATKYSVLSENGKRKITNYSKLESLVAKIQQLEFASYKDAKKTEVNGYVASLNYTESSYNATNWALIQGYITSFNTEIETKTTNADIDTLVTATENLIKAVKIKAITDIEEAIDALPAADSITLANKSAVESIRTAYNALSEKKALVDSTKVAKLVAIEAKLETLTDIDEYKTDRVTELNNHYATKVEADYSAANWTSLTTIKTNAITAINNAETKAAAKTAMDDAIDAIDAINNAVEEKIAAIGTVALTTESKTAIDTARTAYDALEATKKNNVRNYATLTAAEASYLALYKTAKKTEVTTYATNKGEVNYTPSKWISVQNYATNANTDIDAATTLTAIDTIVSTAKTNIDAVETDAEGHYVITEWTTPVSMAGDRAANLTPTTGNSSYYTRDNTYVVGDDNAFVLLPSIRAEYQQVDNEEPVVVGETITVYRTDSKVYSCTDDTFANCTELTGNDLANVVDIDEYSFSFDFTNEAVNHFYRITIAPHAYTTQEATDYASFNYTLDFKVVDGYNVTDAKELGLIANSERSNKYSNAYNYVEAWRTFLTTNNITANPTDTKALILHNNLNVTLADIPSQLRESNTYLRDDIDVYERGIAANDTYAIYGNYYKIDASGLSQINTATAAGGVSHTSFIKIYMTDELNYTEEKSENTNVYISDLTLVGNWDSDAEDAASNGFGSLIMNKFSMATFNITNVNIRNFYINLFGDDYFEDANGSYNRGTVNVRNVHSYQAYQDNLFVYGATTFNFYDSVLGSCGGPIAVLQHVDADEDTNANPIVNIDEDTVVSNFVTGSETWFTTMGVQAMVAKIQGLNQLLEATTGYSKGFVSGTGTMNVIAVSMGTGYSLDSTDQSRSLVTVNGNPVEDTLQDATDNPKGLNALLPIQIAENVTLQNAYAAGAPVIVADTGAVGLVTQASENDPMVFNTLSGNFADASIKYITIYLGGKAFTLQYNLD